MIQQNRNLDQRKTLQDFLIPNVWGAAAYVLVALLGLSLLNAKRIWSAYTENIALNPDSLSQSVQGSLVNFQLNKTVSFIGDISVILFWAAMGSVIYAAIWLTQNSLSGVKSEIGGKQITGDLVKRNYLNSLVAHYLFFAALSIITLMALYTVVVLVLPVVSTAFYGAVINISDHDVKNIVIGIVAVLFMAFVLHLLNLLLKIYVRFWRIYIRAQ